MGTLHIATDDKTVEAYQRASQRERKLAGKLLSLFLLKKRTKLKELVEEGAEDVSQAKLSGKRSNSPLATRFFL